MHRETHHPTMHNVPNAPLNLQIELNMKGQKQTRFVGNFIKLAHIQYPFEHGEERKILAFVKTEVSWCTIVFVTHRMQTHNFDIVRLGAKAGSHWSGSYNGRWHRLDKIGPKRWSGFEFVSVRCGPSRNNARADCVAWIVEKEISDAENGNSRCRRPYAGAELHERHQLQCDQRWQSTGFCIDWHMHWHRTFALRLMSSQY